MSSCGESSASITDGPSDNCVVPFTPKSVHISFGVLPEESIRNPFHAGIAFQFSGKDSLLIEIGVNSEAERLFGYSKQDFYFRLRHYQKYVVSRLIHKNDWKKCSEAKIKALIDGEPSVRLCVTCINKWNLQFKCLLDLRHEFDTQNMEVQRVTFFFIPLPEE